MRGRVPVEREDRFGFCRPPAVACLWVAVSRAAVAIRAGSQRCRAPDVVSLIGLDFHHFFLAGLPPQAPEGRGKGHGVPASDATLHGVVFDISHVPGQSRRALPAFSRHVGPNLDSANHPVRRVFCAVPNEVAASVRGAGEAYGSRDEPAFCLSEPCCSPGAPGLRSPARPTRHRCRPRRHSKPGFGPAPGLTWRRAVLSGYAANCSPRADLHRDSRGH